jgi:hypothetical protein
VDLTISVFVENENNKIRVVKQNRVFMFIWTVIWLLIISLSTNFRLDELARGRYSRLEDMYLINLNILTLILSQTASEKNRTNAEHVQSAQEKPSVW